jgi:hypothetical protein
MSLTLAQQEEAKRVYIRSKLTPAEKAHYTKLCKADAKVEAAQAAYDKLQKSCPHPLIAREHKNEASTGGWDRGDDSYWTSHKCTLCGLRWSTDQRWDLVGGRRGMPDDEEAKLE